MNTNHLLVHTVYAIALTSQFASAQVAPAKIIPGAGAPIGIAATPTELLYSEPYCQTTPGSRVINSVNPSTSAITLFATLPDEIAAGTLSLANQLTTCGENYFAISAGQGGFLSFAGDVYVNTFTYTGTDPGPFAMSNHILHYSKTGTFVSEFAGPGTLGTLGNHAGIIFDTTGTFQNALIETGEQGVMGFNASGAVIFHYPNPGTLILENATVAPITYAPCKGCLLIAAENPTGGSGAIYMVLPGTPSGKMPTPFSTAQQELEDLSFVSAQSCSIGGYSYFVSGYHSPNTSPQAISTNGEILAYTAGQIAPFTGQFLAPDELSGLVYAYSAPNTSSVFSNTGFQLEDATTVPCAPVTGCTLTQGGYKNNFNNKILPLTLGMVSYTQAQINSILQDNAIKGNGLLSLAHQLITAKLNIIYGAGPDPTTAAAINAADALIGSLVVPPIGNGFLDPSVTSALETILDNFNNRGPECTK
jgi:hypothetical protein